MITKDLHMHTVFCDGMNTAEEMALSAIEKGLTTVGLSGHSYTFFDESYCMSKENTELYIAQVNSLKEKYKEKIEVLLGIEQDYYSDHPTDAFDYVIGSAHYLKLDDEYVPVDESADILRAACDKYFGGDIYALCERYFETVADVVRRTKCDIIGHFDLISKFIEKAPLFDPDHTRYVKAWKTAVDELIPFDAVFEINTGAISRGYRTSPYPSEDMIRYIKSKNGRLILSSDAHRKEDIAFGFDKFEKYI